MDQSLSRRAALASLATLATGAVLGGPALAQAPAPAPRRRLIDVHHHFFPPAYQQKLIEWAPQHPGQGVPPFVRTWTPQVTLDAMDQAGIATAVLSISSIPNNWFDGTPAEKRRWARLCNEWAADLLRAHPGRFGLFAAMPMPDVEGTLAEIAYALDTLKADGIGFMTSFGDKWPGDPSFAPVWDELDRRGAVAYFHPLAPNCCGSLVAGVPDSFLEYPYDTGRAVMSLLFNGAFAKHRNIKWLFSHSGGAVPVLAERVVTLTKFQRVGVPGYAPNGIDYELKHLFYDTANALDPAPLAALLKYVPISQVMFGTDFPYVSTVQNAHNWDRSGLPGAQMAAIARTNAMAMFPRLRA